MVSTEFELFDIQLFESCNFIIKDCTPYTQYIPLMNESFQSHVQLSDILHGYTKTLYN
jgi:hypothetical protein